MGPKEGVQLQFFEEFNDIQYLRLPSFWPGPELPIFLCNTNMVLNSQTLKQFQIGRKK